MDTKHIKAVHYVHATDPIGRLIIQEMGDLWAGTDPLPLWHKDEYLRGQVETLCRTVRLITPHETYFQDEEDKDRAAVLIEAAAKGALDTALLALYSPDHDFCHTCNEVTRWDGEQCTACHRAWGEEAPPKPLYPHVEVDLVGIDGNALTLVGHVAKHLRAAGVDQEERNKLWIEATSGDYDNVLITIRKWVTVL